MPDYYCQKHRVPFQFRTTVKADFFSASETAAKNIAWCLAPISEGASAGGARITPVEWRNDQWEFSGTFTRSYASGEEVKALLEDILRGTPVEMDVTEETEEDISSCPGCEREVL